MQHRQRQLGHRDVSRVSPLAAATRSYFQKLTDVRSADFTSLNASCGAQNYTGAAQAFSTYIQSPSTAGYVAPTLTATGGGDAASGSFSAATDKVAATVAAGASSAAVSAATTSAGAAAASGSSVATGSASAAASTSAKASSARVLAVPAGVAGLVAAVAALL